MYDFIINPVNGKKIKTNSKQGKAIIEKYRKEYNNKFGGSPSLKSKLLNLTSALPPSCSLAILAIERMNFSNFEREHIDSPKLTLIQSFQIGDGDVSKDKINEYAAISKDKFHNEWKKYQVFNQLKEEADVKLPTMSDYIYGDIQKINYTFYKLYPPYGTTSMTNFNNFFNEIISIGDDAKGTISLRKIYKKLVPYTKQISFDLYIKSVLPRACGTKQEIFEKNPDYFLNQTIKKTPENYWRMYKKTLEEKVGVDGYKRLGLNPASIIKEFHETGLFYYGTPYISRIDQRVWKKFWQLGYIQAILDYNTYINRPDLRTQPYVDLAKQSIIDEVKDQISSQASNLLTTGAAAVVSTAATVVSGPLGTAIPVLMFATKIGEKIVERRMMNDTNKYMNLIQTDVEIKGIPDEPVMERPWYELPHFAGYYFCLSEKFNELQNEEVRHKIKKTIYG